ncbi:hypothetical protein EYZ11_006042 [Aspergillus tanneri]|uniref:Uncharacterized protein n=1 Tax=Aspergillus tanneri TaxID=1220188 RepID=A0A4S3JIR6_9EURO|nr:hypothetical protein EYZ11_006042 [Aspergillus tanneri]
MSNTPLRLFSLDDGYPTAISQLVILLGLMRSIQIQNALPSPLSPHEVFDLIGATGHGELNALLLGKVSKKRKLQGKKEDTLSLDTEDQGCKVDDYSDATIWQAGRASTADPVLFKHLRLMSLGFQDKLIDGTVKSLREQAASIFAAD